MVRILYNGNLENEVQILSALIGRLAGAQPTVDQGAAALPYTIFLETKPISIKGKTKEAYRIEIKDNKSVHITGSDAAGVLYGIQTLLTMIPSD